MERGSLLGETRRLLHRFDLRARKRLGQHFLIDGRVLDLILSSADLSPSDVVIEVGPGLGILTQELTRRVGRVIAVELDDSLAAMLKDKLATFRNVTIINKDILKVEPADLLSQAGLPPQPYKVVANLPYYITSPVLRHFLEASVKPQMMLVMVQKEVADVIAARPGDRSVLSIAIQFYGKPTIISRVPARAFYPPPEVDSALLRIDLHPQPIVDVSDANSFFKVVRAGFTNPRKQIANSLAQGLGIAKEEAQGLLASTGIDARRRAETLTVEEWAELWRRFSQSEEKVEDADHPGPG